MSKKPKAIDAKRFGKSIIPGRTIERTQGCWNCTGSSHEMAMTHWKTRRQVDLAKALEIAISDPIQGEMHPKCQDIKRMVNNLDHGIASGTLTMCVANGVDADDNPVGDFVSITYLCRKWNARQGASIARAGEAPDDLPMELEDKLKP